MVARKDTELFQRMQLPVVSQNNTDESSETESKKQDQNNMLKDAKTVCSNTFNHMNLFI